MRSAGILLLAFLVASRALAQCDDEPAVDGARRSDASRRRSALALAALYAAGQRAKAVGCLEGWGEVELKKELGAIRHERGEKGGGQPAEGLLRAAVMLHTDREAFERLQAPVVESVRECGINRHAGYARALNSLLVTGSDAARDFARRWFTAMALSSQWDLCFDDVQRWASEGLKWFPRDAELLLTRGTAAEISAAMVPPPRFVQRNPAHQWNLMDKAKRRQELTEARRDLEAALAEKPDLHEARVRLGRVLWRLEKPADAAAALRAAIERAPEPNVLYLAHLFLGRVLEDAGDRPGAIERYRAALAVDPQAQAAAVALSQALLQAGHDAEARDALEHALQQAPRLQPRDPHMSYHLGRSNLAEGMLERLREETLQ